MTTMLPVGSLYSPTNISHPDQAYHSYDSKLVVSFLPTAVRPTGMFLQNVVIPFYLEIQCNRTNWKVHFLMRFEYSKVTTSIVYVGRTYALFISILSYIAFNGNYTRN